MSRRKTQAELDAEMEQREREDYERRLVQDNCYHFNCHPSKWYWSGQIEEMTCDECGLTKWFEDHGDG